MKIFSFLFLLSLIQCHLLVFALTLPALTNVTAEPILSNIKTDAQAHCPQDESIRNKLPLSTDCFRAIRELPRNDYVGYFHIGGSESLWRLPHSKSHQSCTALVNLSEDIEVEMGSWRDVGTAAMDLLLRCQVRSEPGNVQRTGGWIKSGFENRLWVEVLRSRSGVENRTGVGMAGGMHLVDVG